MNSEYSIKTRNFLLLSSLLLLKGISNELITFMFAGDLFLIYDDIFIMFLKKSLFWHLGLKLR